MRKLAFAAAFSALALSPGATAQVFECGQDNRAAGTIVGALVGATAGGVIANNVERDVFVGHGYGHHGFRHGHFVTRRGNQEAGIILGAIAGGLVGNAVAASNARNCPTYHGNPSQAFGDPYARGTLGQNTGFSHVDPRGPVDLNALKYGDPFGGRPGVRTSAEPATAIEEGPRPLNRRSDLDTPLAGGVFVPVCDTVFQTTELPDGASVRSPVEVCQYSEGGEWVPTN